MSRALQATVLSLAVLAFSASIPGGAVAAGCSVEFYAEVKNFNKTNTALAGMRRALKQCVTTSCFRDERSKRLQERLGITERDIFANNMAKYHELALKLTATQTSIEQLMQSCPDESVREYGRYVGKVYK